MKGKILYVSFQNGTELPGFVCYALKNLSRTSFPTVLLTNDRKLSSRSRFFLEKHHIECFFTVNRGFDFGMWKRYLSQVSEEEICSWDYLILINDSVVYYKNRFLDFFHQCESSSAEMISLTANQENQTKIPYHLQSFFLYLKPPAIRILVEHLRSTPEQETMDGTILNFEVEISQKIIRNNLKIEPLFKTEKPILFDYASLIDEGAGFVKRRLLERRFSFGNIYHFLNSWEERALLENYVDLIQKKGSPDSDFLPDYFSEIDHKSKWGKAFSDIRFRIYLFLGRWKRFTYLFYKKAKSLFRK